MFEVVRIGALVAAAITMGIMTGVLHLYAHTIMPGLARADDRTFVGGFQSMDRAIINPWFMASFLGAFVFTALAAVLNLGADVRPVLPWVATALGLYLVVLGVTFGVNVPLNNRLLAAGEPDRIADLGAVRGWFEARWVRWNLVRVVACTAAFGCLVWALVEYGRATA